MKWFWWVGIAVAVLLGTFTLFPAPASKPCLLGYYALCSFTPTSTVLCLAIAGALFWFGQKKAAQAASI